MADLASIARIPNVASAVLGDLAGGFYDAIREADGESVASVTGFISTRARAARARSSGSARSGASRSAGRSAPSSCDPGRRGRHRPRRARRVAPGGGAGARRPRSGGG